MAQEQISIFDMFKIGIGPSSSHTLGPWRAAQRFVDILSEKNLLEQTQSIHILLYGSLAKTGVGHGTDTAVLLGLSGDDPVTFDTDQVIPKVEQIKTEGKICLGGIKEIDFSYSELKWKFASCCPSTTSLATTPRSSRVRPNWLWNERFALAA
jgi:L-serine dehydratase